jgi:hypothetical protein
MSARASTSRFTPSSIRTARTFDTAPAASAAADVTDVL